MTGRYPHNSGALGFNSINRGVPTLVEALHDAGYYTGCLAKNAHVVPERKAAFDESVQASQLQNGRNPAKYYEHTKAFLAHAKTADKPFFLMANAQDPHRPFAGSQQEAAGRRAARNARNANNANTPDNAQKDNAQRGDDDQADAPAGVAAVRRVYKPEEISVPGFLPDLPDVRTELAQYFTSVHRADETVGAVLKALDESGQRDSTLVMFLSDHGMPLPFAKTNVYYNSTRTPWIVRWPGVVKPGAFDERHFVTGIDLAPTVLEALGLPPLEGADGRSFLPVLKGEPQAGRDHAFTHINTIASQASYPMRSVQDARFGYLYNAWSDGARVFRNESQAGLTMKAMNAAARGDAEIAARVKQFVYRTKEEFYDYAKDPDALHNLIDDPAHAADVARFRARMRQEMKSSGDYLLEQFTIDVK
jgi:N-sulfoglucosamine sulfohydrolase